MELQEVIEKLNIDTELWRRARTVRHSATSWVTRDPFLIPAYRDGNLTIRYSEEALVELKLVSAGIRTGTALRHDAALGDVVFVHGSPTVRVTFLTADQAWFYIWEQNEDGGHWSTSPLRKLGAPKLSPEDLHDYIVESERQSHAYLAFKHNHKPENQ